MAPSLHLTKGIVIAGLTATPLFIAGLVGFYPVLWLDLLVGVAAVSWAVYLMYLGIPIVMNIPEERGFLCFQRRTWRGPGHPDLPDGRLGDSLGLRRRTGIYGLSAWQHRFFRTGFFDWN